MVGSQCGSARGCCDQAGEKTHLGYNLQTAASWDNEICSPQEIGEGLIFLDARALCSSLPQWLQQQKWCYLIFKVKNVEAVHLL